MRLYAPMLAKPSTPVSGRRGIDMETLQHSRQWLAQEKLDGIRAVLYYDGNRARIFNRTGREITERFPEVARVKLPGPVVLDGEIVAKDRTFQTVATRDKQTKDFTSHSRSNPCYFAAFDFLESNGTSLLNVPLKDRLILLKGVIGRRRLVRPVRTSQDLLALWNEVVAAGGEGIVAKMRSSAYLPGARAESWIKFKHVQRITAVAVGYEVGRSRELGAIRLALINDNIPLPIGKVGTGWTERQGDHLLQRLKAGNPFLVEIEALNRTLGNELRFPVFRGERTDLPLTAASAQQLALLPTY